MNQWDEIDRIDFEGDMAEMAEAIGVEATKKLLEIFGGESIYFPKPQSVIRSCRDRRIYQEFNGFNFRELANRYELTTRQIRVIVHEQREKKPKTSSKQIELFKRTF